MKTIKFSHRYKKLAVLNSNMTARLLIVQKVNLEDLSRDFLNYDTEEIFKLPTKGKYIFLLFQANGGLFTTLRPMWPTKKFLYYQEAIGEIFNVKIVDNFI